MDFNKRFDELQKNTPFCKNIISIILLYERDLFTYLSLENKIDIIKQYIHYSRSSFVVIRKNDEINKDKICEEDLIIFQEHKGEDPLIFHIYDEYRWPNSSFPSMTYGDIQRYYGKKKDLYSSLRYFPKYPNGRIYEKFNEEYYNIKLIGKSVIFPGFKELELFMDKSTENDKNDICMCQNKDSLNRIVVKNKNGIQLKDFMKAFFHLFRIRSSFINYILDITNTENKKITIRLTLKNLFPSYERIYESEDNSE